MFVLVVMMIIGCVVLFDSYVSMLLYVVVIVIWIKKNSFDVVLVICVYGCIIVNWQVGIVILIVIIIMNIGMMSVVIDVGVIVLLIYSVVVLVRLMIVVVVMIELVDQCMLVCVNVFELIRQLSMVILKIVVQIGLDMLMCCWNSVDDFVMNGQQVQQVKLIVNEQCRKCWLCSRLVQVCSSLVLVGGCVLCLWVLGRQCSIIVVVISLFVVSQLNMLCQLSYLVIVLLVSGVIIGDSVMLVEICLSIVVCVVVGKCLCMIMWLIIVLLQLFSVWYMCVVISVGMLVDYVYVMFVMMYRYRLLSSIGCWLQWLDSGFDISIDSVQLIMQRVSVSCNCVLVLCSVFVIVGSDGRYVLIVMCGRYIMSINRNSQFWWGNECVFMWQVCVGWMSGVDCNLR